MRERLYNDYIMPNRYKEYEELIKKFQVNNYEFICVKDYKKLEENVNKRYIIIRHDIDSDISIARKMFEIEKRLGVKSTYYFRLCTIDKKLIKDIDSYGSEVGYHYEELAQFCKENKRISKQFAEEHLAEIQERMINNIQKLEKENNIKIKSIASHGDFVNRKIGLTNKEAYNENLKEGMIEAYDIEKNIEYRTADTMYPVFWKEDPEEAIKTEKNKVLILVHPRWWNKAPITRMKIDIMRLIDAIKYRKK